MQLERLNCWYKNLFTVFALYFSAICYLVDPQVVNVYLGIAHHRTAQPNQHHQNSDGVITPR